MITINGNEHNTIKYSCDCGVSGECMVKLQDGNKATVIDITCPHCGDTERIKLIQYDSEKARKSLIKKDATLSWSAILDNKLKG